MLYSSSLNQFYISFDVFLIPLFIRPKKFIPKFRSVPPPLPDFEFNFVVQFLFKIVTLDKRYPSFYRSTLLVFKNLLIIKEL